MAGEHTAAADAGRVDHCALGIKVGRRPPDHHAYGGRKDNDATHKTPLIRRWLARHPHDILDLAFVDVAMQVAVRISAPFSCGLMSSSQRHHTTGLGAVSIFN